MKVRTPLATTLIVSAMVALSGCASVPPDVARRAPEIKVYDTGELPVFRYEVVRRIWVDSWRTAAVTPTYATRDDAVAALQTEAAVAGADGLINVICLDQAGARWLTRPGPAVLCYGNAIRLKAAEG